MEKEKEKIRKKRTEIVLNKFIVMAIICRPKIGERT
jgi:hypothetical protein